MKLKKFDLNIPIEFYEVLENIRSILVNPSNIAIGGGCLSDLYMHQFTSNPYFLGKFPIVNDIDVFVSEEFSDLEDLKRIFPDLQTVVNRSKNYFDSTDESTVYHATYKGYKVEMIVVKSLRRIYDFDFRFRQFYLFDKDVFASEEAVEDIHNKKLFLVNPYSGRSSFVRRFLFEKRYGFQMDKRSEQFLYSYLNHNQYIHTKFIEYVKEHSKLDYSLKNKITEWLTPLYRKSSDPSILGEETYSSSTSLRRDVTFLPVDDEELFKKEFKTLFYSYINCSSFNNRFDAGLLSTRIEDILCFESPSFPQTLTIPLVELLDEELLKKAKEIQIEFLEIVKTYRFVYLTQPQGRNDLKKINDWLLMPLNKENLAQFLSQGSLFLKFLRHIEEYLEGDDYQYFSTKFDLMRVKGDLVEITFAISNKQQHFSATLNGLVLMAEISVVDEFGSRSSSPSYLYFRKCTNGKFTLSFSEATYRNNSMGFIFHSVLRKLQESYPDYFEFFSPSLKGIFDFFHYGSEHFFRSSHLDEEKIQEYHEFFHTSAMDIEKYTETFTVPLQYPNEENRWSQRFDFLKNKDDKR